MAADTTTPAYWLNWRFLLCAIWILVAISASVFVIWRNERREKGLRGQNVNSRVLYEGEAWGTCFKSVHPIWLLAYRVVAFCFSFVLITADVVRHGVNVLYFYTEWTFTLVAVYFGLASAISIYGCIFYQKRANSDEFRQVNADLEVKFHVAIRNGENRTTLDAEHSDNNLKYASRWECALQIILQITAGAVALTDTVFWLVLFPFFMRGRALNFLVVSMHSANAVFILGDVILNKLHFPYFRIAYFTLWTSTFVVFQWILHVFVSMRWPYPFLDLSSQYAPLWYLAVGVLLVPCFTVTWLLFKVKKYWLSKCFTETTHSNDSFQ